MENTDMRLFSALLRLLLTVLIIIYPMMNGILGGNATVFQNPFFVFWVLLLLSSNIVYHINDRLKIPCLTLSFVTATMLYFTFSPILILVVILNIMDCLVILKINSFWGLVLLLLFPFCGQHYFDFIIFTVLMSFLFYLVHSVVNVQSKYIETGFKNEKRLLNRLSEADKKHKYRLQSTILRFENQRLQEKSELSQNLHDKIGHAINGSIFKLEGAKLLVNKDTSRSSEMISDVITALRESVDDIRYMLRNEKPSSELMNIGHLRVLLSDFTDKYDIETSLVVEGDAGRVSLTQYGIFYDNTIEALSNSLKYADCSKISVSLGVYNRIIRYTILDNGNGTQNITDSMGLTGIKERILAVGGTVNISGENGFEIIMLIPITDFEKGAEKH